ncbi:dihydroneopterin aldolase [Marinobacter bohaiensis]|uniref:dihydroneopterin aldolase n=1 Tax=Marinobacter bohaiensis TaxID=2201898 RepID=UPI000DAE8D3F|nr:dihydroneopterin aldolase [Marinobacter bohaiensis]
MTDTVLVEGLAVETVIGEYEWERHILQRVEIDLEMAWDNRVPGASDDVSDALDYAAVSEVVRAWFRANQPRLLEAAAEALAADIRQRFGVTWLQLTLRKPGAVPDARSVGVRIERGQRS